MSYSSPVPKPRLKTCQCSIGGLITTVQFPNPEPRHVSGTLVGYYSPIPSPKARTCQCMIGRLLNSPIPSPRAKRCQCSIGRSLQPNFLTQSQDMSVCDWYVTTVQFPHPESRHVSAALAGYYSPIPSSRAKRCQCSISRLLQSNSLIQSQEMSVQH